MPWRDKEKQREYERAYRERHKAYIKFRQKLYNETPEGREKERERCRRYRERHPEKLRERDKRYNEQNPGRHRKHKAKRKLASKIRNKRVRQATPPWADKAAMKAIYLEAAMKGMSVDHVIPLKGRNVCGLHVENNLRLVDQAENSRKSNRFTPVTIR